MNLEDRAMKAKRLIDDLVAQFAEMHTLLHFFHKNEVDPSDWNAMRNFARNRLTGVTNDWLRQDDGEEMAVNEVVALAARMLSEDFLRRSDEVLHGDEEDAATDGAAEAGQARPDPEDGEEDIPGF